MEKEKLFKVGRYIKAFNAITGQTLPCGYIYQSVGLIKHTKSHHPELVGRVGDIPAVIKSPDFIGVNPKEPESVELVKRMDGNVMVCIKLDRKNDYLYVATVFEITDAKLGARIASGRLKKVDNK